MARLDLQHRLATLLGQVGQVHTGRLLKAREIALPVEFVATVVDPIYRRLGGVLPQLRLAPGGWDVEYNGIGVELDEALHFNRYRAITLESAVYARLRSFPLAAYRTQCATREMECFKAGRYAAKWATVTRESPFGAASPPGEFVGNGPTRWKQRALYDFVKDVLPLVSRARVARVSVWDELKTSDGVVLVRDALRAVVTEERAVLLANLVAARATVTAEPRST